MENNNINVTENTKLNELNGWETRKASLAEFVETLGETTIKTLLTEGCKKSGLAQSLGILLHCSSGYVGDKFRGKSTEEKVEVVAELIAPALTPEEIKQRNFETACKVISDLQAANVPEAVIRLSVGNMPEGKRALAEKLK